MTTLADLVNAEAARRGITVPDIVTNSDLTRKGTLARLRDDGVNLTVASVTVNGVSMPVTAVLERTVITEDREGRRHVIGLPHAHVDPDAVRWVPCNPSEDRARAARGRAASKRLAAASRP